MSTFATLARKAASVVVFALFGAGAAWAHDLSLNGGWTVDSTQSSVAFTMVKKGSVIELGRFETVSGTVNENGSAEFQIDMSSVNSGVDLRDVRMRFLLYEVQKYANATISMQINQGALDGIRDGEFRDIEQSLRVSFRDLEKIYPVKLRVYALDHDMVSVSALEPILVYADDFNLAAGFRKLEEAVELVIVPNTSINFNIILEQNDP